MQSVNIWVGAACEKCCKCADRSPKQVGQRLQGMNQKMWGHISSHARTHGSSIVVLSAIGNHEMFPVRIGGKIEKTG